jgi:hypothetical protein
MSRKVFTAGEVLAAADVNNFLMDQSVMSFAGTAARGSAIGTAVEGMVTFLEDSNILSIYDGSVWKNSLGTTGGILQVVSTSKTDTFSTNSATYTTVTGLTATITPTSTSSKILVMVQLSVGMTASQTSYGHYKVTRGGTDIYIGDAASNRVQGVFGGYLQANLTNSLFSHSIIDLDSPSSTSALTYQVEARRGSSATTIYINRSEADADDANHSRGASSITLMEVAG